jgi:hypothetical protein
MLGPLVYKHLAPLEPEHHLVATQAALCSLCLHREQFGCFGQVGRSISGRLRVGNGSSSRRTSSVRRATRQ